MEEEKTDTRIQDLERFAFPVLGLLMAYTLISLLVWVFWDAFAADVHLPLLSYSGALGLVGLVLVLFGLAVTAYTIAVRDWGE